jgi:hypothetical protein
MAGILGVRAQGHAARIRWWGRQPWGRRGALPHGASQEKAEEGGKKTGKGADVRAPLGSETRRWVGDRRASVG